MSRVLLTGTSGFVGSEVLKTLLRAGWDVHSLGRTKPSDARAHHHPSDLLADSFDEVCACVRPTHLLHLAWYAAPGKFWSAPENLDWVAASLRLVRSFAAHGGARAVVAGTCAEYDWSAPLLDERTTPLAPATLYGEAKAATFRILDKAAPALGISFGWGRIFFPYGPQEKSGRLLGDLFDKLDRGEPMELSAGTQVRDFIHVTDVADALVQFLASEVTGPVNIASGDAVSVRDIVTRAARLAGGEHLIRFGSRPLQPGEPPVMEAAVDRLRGEVGFRAQFSLDSGLADMHRGRRTCPTGKS